MLHSAVYGARLLKARVFSGQPAYTALVARARIVYLSFPLDKWIRVLQFRSAVLLRNPSSGSLILLRTSDSNKSNYSHSVVRRNTRVHNPPFWSATVQRGINSQFSNLTISRICINLSVWTVIYKRSLVWTTFFSDCFPVIVSYKVHTDNGVLAHLLALHRVRRIAYLRSSKLPEDQASARFSC